MPLLKVCAFRSWVFCRGSTFASVSVGPQIRGTIHTDFREGHSFGRSGHTHGHNRYECAKRNVLGVNSLAKKCKDLVVGLRGHWRGHGRLEGDVVPLAVIVTLFLLSIARCFLRGVQRVGHRAPRWESAERCCGWSAVVAGAAGGPPTQAAADAGDTARWRGGRTHRHCFPSREGGGGERAGGGGGGGERTGAEQRGDPRRAGVSSCGCGDGTEQCLTWDIQEK
eukprot:gene25596-biopygen21004